MSEFKQVFRSRYLSHWQSLLIVQQSVIYHKSHKANMIFDVIFLARLPIYGRLEASPQKATALTTELHPSSSRGFLLDRPKKQLKI
jgi:hypothetical protein